jgi:nicotinic acetylcholine receptor
MEITISTAIKIHIHINDTDETVIDRGIDITDVYPNAEWDIINVTARRKEKIYTCCADTIYIDITFNVTFRRRILFYSLNLIMPCVSISTITFVDSRRFPCYLSIIFNFCFC